MNDTRDADFGDKKQGSERERYGNIRRLITSSQRSVSVSSYDICLQYSIYSGQTEQTKPSTGDHRQ